MNVVRGSAADTTTRAATSVPSTRATPVARPPVVSTRSTSAPVTISAPKAWAARARTWVNPPLPPLWNDHDPRSPSCWPRWMNSSTSPEPGDIGPSWEPITPEEASHPLTMSASK